MDVARFVEVLGRHKLLLALGLILATALTFIYVCRVQIVDGEIKVSYRETESWSSHSTILVTQSGFPLGRSVYDEVISVEEGETRTFVPRFNSSDHFVGLAQLYSRFATSDPVRLAIRTTGPLNGIVRANPLVDASSGSTLPVVDLSGNAKTKSRAMSLANRATVALIAYIEDQQDANEIAASKRVQLLVLNQPRTAQLVEGRSITRPVFIFLGVIILVIALIYLVDNLRRRSPEDESVETESDETLHTLPREPPTAARVTPERRSA